MRAAVATLLAAALTLAWMWRPRAPLEPGTRPLLLVYAAFGCWALWFALLAPGAQEPPALALWKPTIAYWTLTVVLIAAPLLGWGYPARAIVGAYFVFSNREWRWINLALAVFTALLGGLNIYIGYSASLGGWEGFKYACMVNVAGVLLLRISFVWLDMLVRAVGHWYGRIRPPRP